MSYANTIYVVEVQSDTCADHWTDMFESSLFADAIDMAQHLCTSRRYPSERVRIRQFDIEATYRADGSLAIEPYVDRQVS